MSKITPEFNASGLLIDWLTLRYPLNKNLGDELYTKIKNCMGMMVCCDGNGEIKWQKFLPDWEAIRSDSQGLYWSITCDGNSQQYLTIGASPSSLINSGVNVFGSADIAECASTLVRFASLALGSILPAWSAWDCRRIDITANYDMGSFAQVKQALRLLLGTDAPRRRTNSDSKGGDSVYWNPSSSLRAGKAYHKGAHLRVQLKRGNIEIDEDTLLLADRLLRLELKLGSQWFRRHAPNWREFTPEFLATEHYQFFSSLIGGGDVEVTDMGTLLQELEKVAPSKGRALAAHRTWCLIKTLGFTQTRESMSKGTFNNHLVWLRAAGLSSADLCAGTVVPFRRKSLILGNPVKSWAELRMAA